MLERFLDEFNRKTTREKFLWGRRAALILAAALAVVFLAVYLLSGGKPVLAFGNGSLRQRGDGLYQGTVYGDTPVTVQVGGDYRPGETVYVRVDAAQAGTGEGWVTLGSEEQSEEGLGLEESQPCWPVTITWRDKNVFEGFADGQGRLYKRHESGALIPDVGFSYELGEQSLDDWVSPGWLGRAAAGDTVVKGSLKYYGMACLVLGLAVLIILFGESLNRISLSWYVKGEVEPSDTFYMIQVLGWVLLLGLFVILCISGLNELG